MKSEKKVKKFIKSIKGFTDIDQSKDESDADVLKRALKVLKKRESKLKDLLEGVENMRKKGKRLLKKSEKKKSGKKLERNRKKSNERVLTIRLACYS